jgi:hypothetical protein
MSLSGDEAVSSQKILKVMRPVLLKWLGPEVVDVWLDTASSISATSRIFLEVHPSLTIPRCDIITSIRESDGSLSSWLNSLSHFSLNSIWGKTSSVLSEWQQSIARKKGCLRTDLFLLWLEFDILAIQNGLGNPSIFIALTPYANLVDVANELECYNDLKVAILQFDAMIVKNTPSLKALIKESPLKLGNVGYMASRHENSKNHILRSCWRCNDVYDVFNVLLLANISFNREELMEQLSWLNKISYVNSFMLHLDSAEEFYRDFSLEVNVYSPSKDVDYKKDNLIFDEIVDQGFMRKEQKDIFSEFKGSYPQSDCVEFNCSLHHFKIKFVNQIMKEIKCYWLLRVNKSNLIQ